MAVAGLEEGVITEHTTFGCNGYFRQQGGKQFDPDCVGALFRRLDTIVSVHEDISDRNSEAAS